MSIKRIFDWDEYGRQVMNGDLKVGRWVRLGVERHYRDLKEAPSRGLFFSEEHAQYALQSLLFMKHSKGAWAGQMFVPSAWQQFWIAVAFGWIRHDGSRRFREVNEVVARKNGKTTMLAAIGLYMMLFDGEAGSEVYAAATKREQADVLYAEARQMVSTSRHLSRIIEVRKDRMLIPGKMSRFMPLSRDAKSFDGLNPHCSILDETHAHKTSEVYDVLKTALGARRQPLTWMITTAGFDLSCWGYDMYLYSLKVLDGSVQDDEFLPIVYTVDDPDAWGDPAEWFKANPNMGVSVYPENFRRDFELAVRRPSFQSTFKTKNLNIWLASGTTWIPMEDWRQCADETMNLVDFVGEDCWIGLDLAEKSDIAAVALVFRKNDSFYVFFRLYLNAYEVEKEENDHLRRYRDRGELSVNDGNVTDFSIIKQDIEQFFSDFHVQEIAYDPYFSQYFGASLADEGLPMVEFPQVPRNYGPALIELENLILEKRIRHTGASIIEWMMSNVVIRESKFSGLRHATKEKKENKIDGPIAMMMALSRALADDQTDIMERLEHTRII